MTKMSIFNKTNDIFIADAFNVFQTQTQYTVVDKTLHKRTSNTTRPLIPTITSPFNASLLAICYS